MKIQPRNGISNHFFFYKVEVVCLHCSLYFRKIKLQRRLNGKKYCGRLYNVHGKKYSGRLYSTHGIIFNTYSDNVVLQIFQMYETKLIFFLRSRWMKILQRARRYC